MLAFGLVGTVVVFAALLFIVRSSMNPHGCHNCTD